MMLMTKFGKFKLRFIATINLSVLMSILSLASTTTNYWVKYTDRATAETHYAGMWRSCPNSGLPCTWKNGIIDHWHTLWSIFVRLFVTLGTCGNIICVFIFFTVLFYKVHKSTTTASCTNAENGTCVTTTTTTCNKQTKAARCHILICLMETANWILAISFICMLVGFCIFISSECTLSIWLHCLSMCLVIITSNLLTRTFAALYFQNTRQMMCKNVETTISHSKLAEYNLGNCNNVTATDEEKMALNVPETACIEMQKISGEASGSKEALIQPITPTVNIVELKTAVSNTNLNSQPETVITMSTSNKAINKC